MDDDIGDLANLLGSSCMYSPEEEFILLEKSLETPYENWDAFRISETRNRYIRYLRNLDFTHREDIEKNIEIYIHRSANANTNRNAYEENEYLFVLSKRIDFEIHTIVSNIRESKTWIHICVQL